MNYCAVNTLLGPYKPYKMVCASIRRHWALKRDYFLYFRNYSSPRLELNKEALDVLKNGRHSPQTHNRFALSSFPSNYIYSTARVGVQAAPAQSKQRSKENSQSSSRQTIAMPVSLEHFVQSCGIATKWWWTLQCNPTVWRPFTGACIETLQAGA